MHTTTYIITPLLVVALAACVGTSDSESLPTAPEAEPAMAGPAPSIPGPMTPPAAHTVAGHWRSLSCGERTYERRLRLNHDGSFSAEDLVSPCPPHTACIWSGIVLREGRYTVGGGLVQLTVTSPSGGPGEPFPASLEIEATGAPAEVLEDGSRCVYTRTP